MSAIEQGIITSTTKYRLTKLEAQLEKISASIIKEEMNKPKILTKTEITSFIASALKKQPKQMINLLIKRITLYDDKIQITYNFTNKISPDDDQGFSFIQFLTLSRILTVKRL